MVTVMGYVGIALSVTFVCYILYVATKNYLQYLRSKVPNYPPLEDVFAFEDPELDERMNTHVGKYIPPVENVRHHWYPHNLVFAQQRDAARLFEEYDNRHRAVVDETPYNQVYLT